MQYLNKLIWMILFLPFGAAAQETPDSLGTVADTLSPIQEISINNLPDSSDNPPALDNFQDSNRNVSFNAASQITGDTSIQEQDQPAEQSDTDRENPALKSDSSDLYAISFDDSAKTSTPIRNVQSTKKQSGDAEAAGKAKRHSPLALQNVLHPDKDTSQDTSAILIDTSIVGKSTQASASPKNTVAKKRTENISQIKNTISFGKILWSIIFLLIGYLFIRFTVKLLDLFAERSGRVRLNFKRFIPVYRLLVWILVLFIIIQGIISPSWEAIVALGASVGVAIGFAAQDVLKNIFGGITILFEKPFQVGDKIDVGSHYGEVIHMGFRSTRIVTADDSVVTIPNAELTSKMVSNANSGENNCQVVAEIYLPPDINTSLVRQVALEAAQTSSLVYLRKPITVLFFHELKEDKTYLKMRLKAYVLDIRYEFAFKSEMTEIVLHELYKQGIIRKDL